MGDTIIPNILVAIKAKPKSGKSHLMCTFPDPIVVFSFDQGLPFVRAKFPKKDIRIKQYELPIAEDIRAVGHKKEFTDLWNLFSKTSRTPPQTRPYRPSALTPPQPNPGRRSFCGGRRLFSQPAK